MMYDPQSVYGSPSSAPQGDMCKKGATRMERISSQVLIVYSAILCLSLLACSIALFIVFQPDPIYKKAFEELKLQPLQGCRKEAEMLIEIIEMNFPSTPGSTKTVAQQDQIDKINKVCSDSETVIAAGAFGIIAALVHVGAIIFVARKSWQLAAILYLSVFVVALIALLIPLAMDPIGTSSVFPFAGRNCPVLIQNPVSNPFALTPSMNKRAGCVQAYVSGSSYFAGTYQTTVGVGDGKTKEYFFAGKSFMVAAGLNAFVPLLFFVVTVFLGEWHGMFRKPAVTQVSPQEPSMSPEALEEPLAMDNVDQTPSKANHNSALQTSV